MARHPNLEPTVQIKFSTTEKMKTSLELLVAEGSYGRNISEAAERLLAQKINELKGPARFAEILNRGT